MAFIHGRNARVLVDDAHLSQYFNNADLAFDVDAPETTAFSVANRTYVAGGLTNGTVSLSGFWDEAAGAVDEEIENALGNATDKVFTIGLNTFSPVGVVTYIGSSIYTSYSISSPVDGVVSLTADLQATGGLFRGVSLHPLTEETSTANGTSVDGLAATSNGGVGHLHVTAAGGTTPTLDVTIEDSADDAAFATILTFTQATTSTTSETKSITGTVRRYIRATWTISGSSPAYTFHVSFARK